MSDVICPNCRSIVSAWSRCANCSATLVDHFKQTALAEAPVKRAAGVAARNIANSDVKFDPHLRRVIDRVQGRGIRKLASASAGEGEISVIARVDDVDAFKSLQGVNVITVINPTAKEEDWIVTARIPLDNDVVEEIRSKSFVKNLKASRRLSPCLEITTKETLATEAQLPSDNLADGGKGVIIGIIDFGMDIRHRNFLNPDDTSRILALWDQRQDASLRSPSRFGYGREYRKVEIDEALLTPDPHATLNYSPPQDTSFQLGAHGTSVADVAAGNGLGTSCPGIAPQADIVFVEASTSQIPFESAAVLDNSFGDTRQLLEAIQYIFDFASDRPCVVNISLATYGGPHDGTTLVERGIDQLVSQAPNRAVVIAAGNAFDLDTHASGTVKEGSAVSLKWLIPQDDPSSNELEVWYSGKDRFTLQILDPQGNVQLRVEPGQNREIAIPKPRKPSSEGAVEPGPNTETAADEGIISAHNRLNDPINGDNTIDIFFERMLPGGTWTIELYGESVEVGTFHAWIERDEFGKSKFAGSEDGSYIIDGNCTLGSISCAKKAIVVGAYDAREDDVPLFKSSSAGRTRDGRKQPDVSAPGERVLVAQSLTGVSRKRQSGTSLSAPVVAGVIALMLAEAKARGISLTADEIRAILIKTARKAPLPANEQPLSDDGWDSRYGYGRVSAAGAVADVTAKAAARTSKAARAAYNSPTPKS